MELIDCDSKPGEFKPLNQFISPSATGLFFQPEIKIEPAYLFEFVDVGTADILENPADHPEINKSSNIKQGQPQKNNLLASEHVFKGVIKEEHNVQALNTMPLLENHSSNQQLIRVKKTSDLIGKSSPPKSKRSIRGSSNSPKCQVKEDTAITKPVSFECKLCPFVSTKKNYLTQHIIRKHDLTQVQCLLCPFKTTCQRYLKKHMRYSHNPNPKMYSCEVCTYKTIHLPSLKSHITAKHEPVVLNFACPYCDFRTRKNHRLNRHMNKHNTNPKVYKCSMCMFICYEKQKLEQHLIIHGETMSPKIYNCKYCSFSTEDKGECLKHYRVVHSSRQTVYSCKMCSYESYHRNLLIAHKNIDHSMDPLWFNCKLCAFATLRKEKLVIHSNREHNEENVRQLYQCDECEFKGEDVGKLRDHIYIKHSPYQIWYYCHHCCYKSKTKTSLISHMSFKHSSATFDCKYCSYSGKSLELLKRHINNVHNSNALLYYCYHCNYCTKIKAKLGQHMQMVHLK